MKKFKPWIYVLSAITFVLCNVLTACTPAPSLTVPKYLEDVKPDLQQCISNNSNVTWDGNITMFNGTGGYAGIQGLGKDKGFNIHDIGVGASNSKGQALTVLLKETCLNAYAAQTAYDACLGDETQCMTIEATKSYIDNMSTAMLTVEQQKAVAEHLTSDFLHFDDPIWDLDCETLTVFKEWQEKGVTKGSVKALTEFFQPNGCP